MNKNFKMLKEKEGIIMEIGHYFGVEELCFVENWILETWGERRMKGNMRFWGKIWKFWPYL